MTWWKIGLYGTLLWLAIVMTVGGALVYQIVSRPMGQAADDERARKLGGALGSISAPCLAGVWFFAWTRRRRQQAANTTAKRPPSRKRGR